MANPSAAVFGSDDSIVVPPSGSVCGVFARTEQARLGGIYDAPAGPTRGILRGIVGVEDEAVLEKATRDLIYPKRINPITRMTGKPWTIDGARGLDADGNFPNVSERRGVNFIKRSLEDGLAYVRFEPHDESLRASVIRTSRGFLNTQMQRGAFRSVDPETAYQVVCDDTNNSAQDVFDQRINIDILLATAKPAEFVNISISQDTSAL
ncbi:MAG: phage tail sheath family protein [Gammaproteobacteria bacterium]|nr:phage tail sheath family protein [Gammaproteobacteria bacterium]